MKTRISVLVLAIVATFLASASCSTPQFCASQQSSGGPQLFAYMLGLSPAYMPHPPGYVDGGPTYEFFRQLAGHYLGACGQVVCAESATAARAALAATTHDPNAADPSLFVYPLGYSVADVASGMIAGVNVWNALGGPCIGGYGAVANVTDAGAQGQDAGPCRLLGEACSAYGNGSAPDCCPYQQIVSGGQASNLDCEPLDVDVDDVNGYCRAGLWQPCNDESECFQGGLTPDDQPLDCQDICCIDEGRTCFIPGGGPGLEEQYGGCCPGYNCVSDTIGNGYWCQ